MSDEQMNSAGFAGFAVFDVFETSGVVGASGVLGKSFAVTPRDRERWRDYEAIKYRSIFEPGLCDGRLSHR